MRSRRRLRIEDSLSGVKSAWERPVENEEPVENAEKDRSMSFLTKLLIGSIIFCIVAVSLGAYLFFNGSNLISGDNIDIAVSGPVSVPGGTPVTFEIAVTNKNNIALEDVVMTVDFPAGATNPTNPSEELSSYKELLGDVTVGQTIRKTVSATLFGEQNTQKSVKVSVDYKVKGSSSPFSKEKTYDVLINSSPVNLTVSSFKEITAGQEFTLTFHIKSNSGDTLHNVLLAASYPFGFSYVSSSIAPLGDKATWRLGDLPPGSERTVTVRGKLQGENQETRVFRASIGTQSTRNPNIIGTEFMSAEQEIALQKSFITVGLVLDGNSGNTDAAGTFNQPVRAEITWQNNLPSAISDAEISVKLSGSAYDRTLVQPGSGYFRSSTDEIIWSSQSDQRLASVKAGESGTVSFSITPRNFGGGTRTIANPLVTFVVSVKGKRTQERGVPENLNSIVTRNVRISSAVALTGRIVRSGGQFANTGPIPPKADEKTTYTVIWTIDNGANMVDKAQVTAMLPQYVKWLGKINPSGEDVTYDPRNGQVTWNAGSVGSFTSYRGEKKTVAFQVSLEPNINQIGSSPVLVNDARLSAIDDFTGASLGSTQPFLTTNFNTDPTYRPGDETVRE